MLGVLHIFSHPRCFLDSPSLRVSPPRPRCGFLNICGLCFNRTIFHSLIFIVVLLISGCAHVINLPGDSADLSGGSLSLIHFNDGLSRLLNAGVGMEDYGGVARFATVVGELKKKTESSQDPFNALITVSAGNDFLAGQTFNLSLRKGIPFYDATALDIIGVDAILLARHAFDMGPDVLAEYIESFNRTHPVFLSANLNFSHEPALRVMSEDGAIVSSTIIERGGFKFGLIGVSPPSIKKLASPRRVDVYDDLPGILQKAVDSFIDIGVKRIVVLSNLESIKDEKELIGKTTGVDILVMGTTDKKKRICSSLTLTRSPMTDYPIFCQDAAGRNVVLVGTPGAYCFVGFLKVYFDSEGEIALLAPNTRLTRVLGDGAPDASQPNALVNAKVVIPLAKALSTTSRPVAVSKVFLDGSAEHVGSRETNFGDLAADAVLWCSAALSSSFGVGFPTVALLKSGIFKASLPVGSISDADLFASFASCKSISIIEGVSPSLLKLLLERMLDGIIGKNGKSNTVFPQIAGMSIVFNPTRPAGTRVKKVRLDTGDAIVLNYKILPYAPKVNIAAVGCFSSIDGLRNLNALNRVNIGELPQNAVIKYLSGLEKNGALNGIISAKKYPLAGLRRIMITRE